MSKIMKMMLVSGACSIGLIKTGYDTWGIFLFTFAYYLFTLWVVLGVRNLLKLVL